jgi:hypothetical protein
MKKFYLAIILSFFCSYSFAQCEPPENIPVSIQDTSIPLEFDFTQSEQNISEIAQQAESNIVSENSQVRGLTLLKLDTNLQADIEIIQSGNNFCGYPKSVILQEGYSPLKVYVENIYPQYSCPFKAILEHEERHVRIDAQTLLDNQPLLIQDLTQSVSGKTYTGSDASNVREQIMSDLSNGLQIALQNYSDNRDRLNAINDSPPSINGTIAECNDW